MKSNKVLSLSSNYNKIYIPIFLKLLKSINQDNFLYFKECLPKTNIVFPLFEVFIHSQNLLLKKMTLDSENDRNLLKTAVIEYLNHLNQKESLYKQHRFLPSDINPENKTKDDVRGILISIEILYKLDLKQEFDKERILKKWLTKALNLAKTIPNKSESLSGFISDAQKYINTIETEDLRKLVDDISGIEYI
ncbi:hypothetical protein HOH45_05495 [bacterium]|jgi:hypothetical protein|nr:hypothetical protein [bacterium]